MEEDVKAVVIDISADKYREELRYAYDKFCKIEAILEDSVIDPATKTAQIMKIAVEGRYRMAAEQEKVAI